MSATSLDLDEAFQDLMDKLKDYSQPRVPAVQDGEFVLIANFNGRPIVTGLDRARKVVHFDRFALSVWRQSLDGAVLTRISAWTMCGEWLKFAKPADWHRTDSACAPCAKALVVAQRRQAAVDAKVDR